MAHTEGSRKRISQALHGHAVTQETRDKIAETLRGRKRSQETLARMSEATRKVWESGRRSREAEGVRLAAGRDAYYGRLRVEARAGREAVNERLAAHWAALGEVSQRRIPDD